jgi:hypothetical protein
MLLSHYKRFYFIHVPKSAGMSVRKALLPECVQNGPLWKIYNPLAHWVLGRTLGSYRDRVPFTKHVTAQDQLKLSGYLKDYFGFSFVRNPWDREVSLYHYILKADDHHRGRVVRSLGSFENYIYWRKRLSKDRPQTRWTHDAAGHQLVNFIGRYERLTDDFAEVCKIVGITVTLGRENATRHKDYRCYYSDETAEIVASLYHNDCRVFGYTFDR